MANGDEEEKSFGDKLLSTFLRMGSRLPQVGFRPGSPTVAYGPGRTGHAGPPSAMAKRAQAGIDARKAPDPVPLPGPVQSADPSEYRGLAAKHPGLFESGLVTVHGKLTDTGNALVDNARARGKDIDQMVDFYSKGFVGSDLFLTERGRQFAEIDQTGSIDSILEVTDRTEGFRLYKEAEASGAMDLWEDRMGMGADTWQEFLKESVKQFPSDMANLWPIVRDFPGGAARFYDLMSRRKGPLETALTGGALPTLLRLTRGALTEEEEAEAQLSVDEYLREGLFRMSATYSDGFVAALAYGPGTKEFFTDEDRLRAKYHYRKDQFDIERMEAGEATAEVAGFVHGLKQTVEDDIAFFDGKATAQEELAEIERKKAKAGATVEGAVDYLNELDLIDDIDLSKPLDQRQQSRVEKIKQSMMPVATLASPDVIASVGAGFAISGAFKMPGKLARMRRKEIHLKAEGRRIDAELQAGNWKVGFAKLQTQKIKNAAELAKLQKRIGRIDGTVPGPIAGALGAATRAVRGAPLRVGGAAATATGNILQRIIGPGAGGVLGAIGGVSMVGGPVGVGVGGAVGTLLGLGARGKLLSRFGEKMSRVGQELTQRRMAYPMSRKFAQEAKNNKLKQYHLGREAAYGVTVGLTSKFAKLWRDVFIAELPFSYVAAGGFSQAGGNFLSQAAAESLLVEGPIVGAGKLIGRAAGMQMSGNIKDHNRLAYNAALNFRDQFLTDPDQRAAFDALPPVVKRMYGNAFTNDPDTRIEFLDDLEAGAGFFDPDTNTIVVNPNDPRGVETILAHEFRHSMDMQGFSQPIIDAAVGPRGFLRQKPAEDSTTGVGELIPEFQQWAESYNQIRIKSGRKPYDLTNPEELGKVVLEWSAYSSMDSIASGLRNNVLIEWSRRHPWMRSFYDSLMGRFFRQDSLMNAGMLFDQNGNLATQPGVPGMEALKAHPAISARLERMTKERAGIGFTADERADFDDPNSKRKKPSPTAIRQGDKKALKEVERDMHMDLKTDQSGTVVEVNGVAEVKPEPPPRELLPSLPDKDFEAPKVNEGRGTDNATDLTGALTAPADPKADTIPGEPTELVRRDANVEALKQHFREGYGYNDLQLGMIDDLIDIMSDPNRRGEAVLGYYFPVWMKKLKKARKGNWMQFVPKKGIDAKWYRFVPYGLVQTDVGNVLVKAISMDQVILNAQIIAKSRRGLEVYGGDVGRLMDDFNEMVRNHGRNIQNAARFNPDKLSLLNAVFGDVGRGHKEANLLLQNDPQIKKVRSAVRSYRIERFSQMNSGIKAGFPFSLEKTKAMEMPAQDPTQTVYHGGELNWGEKHGGLLFVSPDREQAAVYAKGQQGDEGSPVRAFDIDPTTLASESTAREAMKKAGVAPVNTDWSVEDSSLHELLDNNFEQFVGEEGRRKFVEEMKSRGFTGVRFMDEDIRPTGTGRQTQENIVLFENPETQTAPGSRALEMPAEDPQVQQDGDRFARTIEEIMAAVPDRFVGTKTPGSPVVAPDGRPYLQHDLSTPVGPIHVTQNVVDDAWADSIEESGPAAQEAIGKLAQEGHNMAPPTKKHWDASSKLPLRDRFWYETSAEAMRISFPEQAKAGDSGKVMDVTAATSPLADPNYNAELTVSILSEDYRGIPSVTPAVVQTGVQDALLGRFGTGEQRKIGSFGQTFRFLSGLTEDAPLSTNDRQVASSFGVPDSVFGSYPVLYEVVSRFYNKVRDHINSQPGTQAMGPWQAWQLQALSWVETRARQRMARRSKIKTEDAYEGDAYAQAYQKVATTLRDAGVPVPTHKGTGLPLFNDKVLRDPRTTSSLVPTATEFAEAQIQTMEVVTKLHDTGEGFLGALEESKALGIGKSSTAAQEVITRHSKRLANRSQEGNKKWSLLTKLATVFGKEIAEVTRVEYGWGTFEGDFQPNIRIPLTEVPPAYREAYLAVLGKHYHQAAQASSHFASVDPKDAQTYSVWFEGADDLSALGNLAEDLSKVGHESNVSIRPNGVLMDIHPLFTDAGPKSINPKTLSTLAKNTGSKPQIIDRAYSSIYIEKGDYGNIVGQAKKNLARDAARKVQEITGAKRKVSEDFVRGDSTGQLTRNKVVNRRAEKVRDTYQLRLDRLKSVEKGLRKASRDLEKDMAKATAAMRKRIDRAKGGQKGQQ